MGAGTLRSFVARALERHGESVESAFPAPFDWRALCADAPTLARRLARGSVEDEPPADDDGDLAPELDLVEAAEGTFLRAYLGGLSGLALLSDDERDPEALLEALLAPLSDEAEARFEALAGERLGSVERALAGQGEALEESTPEGTAATLTEASWPCVEAALTGLTAFDPEREGELPHAVRQVLGGVARIAAVLAAFRWLADGGGPGEGFDADPA